jgi:hypothetical protein
MTGVSESRETMRLGELLLLAALWMLFGFLVWYYLSVFHGIPARIVSNEILSAILGDQFYNIVPNPDRRYLFQVQTQLLFTFPDGSREPLGFIVNPLVYGYGLPLLFGLVMASNAGWRHKLGTLVIGYAAVVCVQIWGVVWQSLKTLAFNFGPEVHQVVADAGISDTAIAMGYQLGGLIFPALIPVIVWVLGSWKEVEQFAGWRPEGKA